MNQQTIRLPPVINRSLQPSILVPNVSIASNASIQSIESNASIVPNAPQLMNVIRHTGAYFVFKNEQKNHQIVFISTDFYWGRKFQVTSPTTYEWIIQPKGIASPVETLIESTSSKFKMLMDRDGLINYRFDFGQDLTSRIESNSDSVVRILKSDPNDPDWLVLKTPEAPSVDSSQFFLPSSIAALTQGRGRTHRSGRGARRREGFIRSITADQPEKRYDAWLKIFVPSDTSTSNNSSIVVAKKLMIEFIARN